MSDPVRVVVADGQSLMLVGITEVLRGEEGVEVVGSTTDGRFVAQLVARERPDMVVIDSAMPDLPAPIALKRIHERSPDVAVVFLGDDAPAEIESALVWGAASYVSRRVAATDLPAIIRLVAAGTIYTPPTTPDPRSSVAERLGLSARELEILSHLAQGSTNKTIAASLWVTEQTVKFHLTNVYRKLGLTSRTAAVRLAHENGLVHMVPRAAAA